MVDFHICGTFSTKEEAEEVNYIAKIAVVANRIKEILHDYKNSNNSV